MTDRLFYWCARALIGLLQALPLRFVARLGRAVGGLVYWLDARHRKVALKNLEMCFGQEMTSQQLAALARENFRRIGENFASAAKTAGMTWEGLKPHVRFTNEERILVHRRDDRIQNIVVAIGHFGNFELYVRFGQLLPQFQCATTYRGLRQPSLDRLLQKMREQSGCRFFERRNDAAALKAAMNQSNIILGLLVDQSAGPSGLNLPFLGHPCSTSTAPAVLALRYNSALHTGVCYRVGLAQWEIEAGDEIPTRDDSGRPRPIKEIMLDVNRAFEAAVRRDPANWFWVHNRWKNGKPNRAPHEHLPI